MFSILLKNIRQVGNGKSKYLQISTEKTIFKIISFENLAWSDHNQKLMLMMASGRKWMIFERRKRTVRVSLFFPKKSSLSKYWRGLQKSKNLCASWRGLENLAKILNKDTTVNLEESWQVSWKFKKLPSKKKYFSWSLLKNLGKSRSYMFFTIIHTYKNIFSKNSVHCSHNVHWRRS